MQIRIKISFSLQILVVIFCLSRLINSFTIHLCTLKCRSQASESVFTSALTVSVPNFAHQEPASRYCSRGRRATALYSTTSTVRRPEIKVAESGAILQLEDVSLSIWNNDIVNDITWSIMPKERWALVGRNGAGTGSQHNRSFDFTCF